MGNMNFLDSVIDIEELSGNFGHLGNPAPQCFGICDAQTSFRRNSPFARPLDVREGRSPPRRADHFPRFEATAVEVCPRRCAASVRYCWVSLEQNVSRRSKTPGRINVESNAGKLFTRRVKFGPTPECLIRYPSLSVVL